ncbi:MAG: hypothetical protein CM15mP59_6810 [Flavobacteriaceae bacterium]|nr:MAG: hypothetical protein CM15mP59_6810 [Flavobacteriaceae bacterium]
MFLGLIFYFNLWKPKGGLFKRFGFYRGIDSWVKFLKEITIMITEKFLKKIIQTQIALIITTFVLVAFETEIYPLVDEDLSFIFFRQHTPFMGYRIYYQ